MPRLQSSVDVFHAIASPTRRALLDLLNSREQTVHSLAAKFRVSLPAISQQLRTLEQAGLVSSRRAGKFRVYRLNAEPLREVSSWLQFYERFWIARLTALGEELRKYSPEQRWR